jgi:two-component system, NarL family, nitrate/nitrite response regulator NarL
MEIKVKQSYNNLRKQRAEFCIWALGIQGASSATGRLILINRFFCLKNLRGKVKQYMNVVIVDTNYLLREGLKKVLSLEECIQVIGEGHNVEEALEIIISKKPDIVMVDIKLGAESGLDVVREIKKKGIPSKFIIFTASSDYRDFRKTEEIGIEGYILKDALQEELIYALKCVYAGGKYYAPNLLTSVINTEKKNFYKEEAVQNLTNREKEVLIKLGKGLKNNEIANSLSITEFTVKKHVGQILLKLGLTDRTQAALYANSHGLVC